MSFLASIIWILKKSGSGKQDLAHNLHSLCSGVQSPSFEHIFDRRTVMSEPSPSRSQDGTPLQELPLVIGKSGRRRAVLLVALALCALAGFGLYQWSAGRIASEWAAVQGAEYPLKAASAGKVLQVAVRDGQLVEAGEFLLALDPVPLERALAEAEAALDLAMRGGVPAAGSDPALREAEKQARHASDAARREEESARDIMEQWTAEHARLLLALRNPHASEAERAALAKEEAEARVNMEGARARLKDFSDMRAEADQELRRLHDAAGNTRPGPVQVELWRTRVEEARAALQNAVLTAPVRGKIFWVKAAQEKNVARGDELMKIMPLEGLWVEARFAAGAQVREGQHCMVELDGGPELEGEVLALSRQDGKIMAKIGISLPQEKEGTENAERALYPDQNAKVVIHTTL